MKVSVTLSLDVDPEEWAATYGTDATAKAVRADALRYVLGLVQNSEASQEGAITFARLSMTNRDGGFRMRA